MKNVTFRNTFIRYLTKYEKLDRPRLYLHRKYEAGSQLGQLTELKKVEDENTDT